MKKDYTKFSESSNKKNEDPVVTDKELEAMNIENPEITEEIVGVVANAIVDEAKETNKTVETIVNEIVDETKDDNSNQNDESETKDDEEVAIHSKVATVTGCKRLNVRKGPSKDSEVLCIIDKDTELTVDEAAITTDDFIKVIVNYNNNLVEGYCMKQFIIIK